MMRKLFGYFSSLVLAFLSSQFSAAQVMFTEPEHTRHEMEYHVFEGNRDALITNLDAHGITDQSEITVLGVQKSGANVVGVPMATGLSKIRSWAGQNLTTISNSFCLVRFTFNSVATGWILYHFYDLTYLHPSSIIAGASVAGGLSLAFMAYTLETDQWILKSKMLFGQFSRYIFLSIFYMASIKAAYLSAEILHSGTAILNKDLLLSEMWAMVKGLQGSVAQMFFTFWNAYRNENRDADIAASSMSPEEQQSEHLSEQAISTTNSFLNSIVNNTLSLLINTIKAPALDAVGYVLVATGGTLFLKEKFLRAKRIRSCSGALQKAS